MRLYTKPRHHVIICGTSVEIECVSAKEAAYWIKQLEQEGFNISYQYDSPPFKTENLEESQFYLQRELRRELFPEVHGETFTRVTKAMKEAFQSQNRTASQNP